MKQRHIMLTLISLYMKRENIKGDALTVVAKR
jgi:hypothetical protein